MPNQFFDVRGLNERIQNRKIHDAPAQGMVFGQGHVGQKSIFGPMKIATADGTGTTTISILSPRVGISYYVHSYTMSISQEVTDDNDRAYIVVTVSGVDHAAVQIHLLPLVAASYTHSGVLDVLCDVNRAVNFKLTTGNILRASAAITYQEVTVEHGP